MKGIHTRTIGLSLLCTAFLLLALITFAAISLIEATDDLNRSQRAAERTSAYQAAVNAAEEKLNALQQTAQKDDSAQRLVSWSEPITDTQVLQISLQLDSAKHIYRITKWKLVNTSSWEPDSTVSGLFQLNEVQYAGNS